MLMINRSEGGKIYKFTLLKFFLLLSALLFLARSAHAQDSMAFPSPQENYNIDPNGIDVITGSHLNSEKQASIGSSEDGFAFKTGDSGNIVPQMGFDLVGSNFEGYQTNLNLPAVGSMSLSVDGYLADLRPTQPYTYPNPFPTSYYSARGDGVSVQVASPSNTSRSYTFTMRDGTTIHATAISLAFGQAAGLISDIVRPDGFTTTFHYKDWAFCNPYYFRNVNGTWTCGQVQGHEYPISSVENSAGYKVFYKYQVDSTNEPDPNTWYENLTQGGGRLGKVIMVNSAVDACVDSMTCTPTAARPTVNFFGSPIETADPYVVDNGVEPVADAAGHLTQYAIRNPRNYCPDLYIDNSGEPWYSALVHSGETAPAVVICKNGENVQDTGNAFDPVYNKPKTVIIGAATYQYSFVDATVTDQQNSNKFDIVRTTTVTGANGYHRVYVSSWAHRHLLSITDENGAVTRFTYDNYGRMTSKRSPEGDTWTYTYDSRGNVTEARHIAKVPGSLADVVYSQTFPATCVYAPTCNKPVTATDPRGAVTNYEYDDTTGQVTKVLSPATPSGIRPESRFSYTRVNGVSVLASKSSCQATANCFGTADEIRIEYQYDANLRVLSETTKTGVGAVLRTVANTYDAVGNKIFVDGPNPGAADTTRFIYDQTRKLVGEIGPAAANSSGSLSNAAHRVSYTGFGQPQLEEEGFTNGQDDTAWQSFTAVKSVRTSYTNELKTLVIGQDSSLSALSAVQYSYDANRRLACTAARMNRAVYGSLPADACTLGTTGSDGPDRITRNVYDAAGQLLQVQKGVGTSLQQNYVTYTYTPNGSQASVTDANGNKAAYTYDGLDRLVQWNFPDKVTTGSVSAADYEAYTYDPNGNRTSLRKRDGRLFTYTYDALNRMTVKTVPGACVAGYACTTPPSSAVRNVYYGYDLRNLQTYARFDSASGADAVDNVYDGLGQLTAQTVSMGGVSRTVSYDYSPDGTRSRITWPDGATVTLGLDGIDRMTSVSVNGIQIAAMAYDVAGREASEARGAVTTTFGYDGLSRLASLSDDLAGTSADLTTTFAYNPAGQNTLRARSNAAYAWNGYFNVSRDYTVNGLNQYTTVSGATSGFGYDSNGNLVSDGTSGFTYDAENRLVASVGGAALTYDPLGRLYAVANATTTETYLYAGDQRIADYNGTGMTARYVLGAGGDNPLIWYDGSATASPRALQGDEHGSIVSIADATGALIAINSYDEYGIPAAGNIGRYGYTGQLWVPQLGLWYYKARFYSPTLGRFMQTDPIGYKDQINLYAYVGNDPVNQSDATGLCPECEERDPREGREEAEREAQRLNPDPLTRAGVWRPAEGSAGARIPDTRNMNDPTSTGRLQAAQADANGFELPPGQPGYGFQNNPASRLDAARETLTGEVDHAIQRRLEARAGDTHREVGDPNRVVREGRTFIDADTGHTVYVNGGRVVITNGQGIVITRWADQTRANTQARMQSGKWIPK